MALEGTYPIVIDEKIAGKLSVYTKGACTCFDAVCCMLDGVVRISVYGGGTEGYLGVLVPEGGQLCLRRSFSRAALCAFPKEIESVERSGRVPAEAAEPQPEEDADEAPTAPETASTAEEPNDETCEEESLLWYSSPDGALVCFDGRRSLIALPLGDERIPEGYGGTQRVIEGRKYIVYTTKNGRIIH